MPCDLISRTYKFDKRYQVIIPNRDDWRLNPAMLSHNAYIWYSNGSRLENNSGYGFHCSQLGNEISQLLGKFPMIFQTEILGFLKSSKESHNIDSSQCPLHFFFDSQASLKALMSSKFTSSLLLECLKSSRT